MMIIYEELSVPHPSGGLVFVGLFERGVVFVSGAIRGAAIIAPPACYQWPSVENRRPEYQDAVLRR
jgi:trehalose utilization protein